jgi:small multidrug resistance pump
MLRPPSGKKHRAPGTFPVASPSEYDCWGAQAASLLQLDGLALIRGTKDTRHHHAVVLKDELDKQCAPRSGLSRAARGPDAPIRTNTRMQKWLFLAVAIVSEVIATSALKSSDGFSRLWPSLLVVTGYASAFYFLSLTLKFIPVAVAYAIWSGAGVALIALISWLVFGETLDTPAIIGLLLIIAGVTVLNVFSRTVSH